MQSQKSPQGPGRPSGGPAPRAETEQPLARAVLDRRRRRDIAIALPVAGLVLFASPLLDLMARGGSLGGIPLGALYVFGSWFGLIWATARIARRLIDDSGDG
jgi:threonine/homoserine efflux transporter RhtA